MSLTVTLTNTTNDTVQLTELYAYVGPLGTLTFSRSQAELDKLIALKTLINAGTLTIDIDPSSTNLPGPSIPFEQYGTVTGLDISDVAIVTQAVVFGIPYD